MSEYYFHINSRLAFSWAIAIFVSIPLSAFADLVIVEDKGGSSALPYYESLNLQSDEKAVPALPPVLIDVDETRMLPVHSETLTPGPVQARTINANGLTQPIFLVGSDRLSLTWLAERREALREINAVGLAVEVPDARALAAIREAADGLRIMPVSGDDIGQRLGIAHYPVLVTATGIEQ